MAITNLTGTTWRIDPPFAAIDNYSSLNCAVHLWTPNGEVIRTTNKIDYFSGKYRIGDNDNRNYFAYSISQAPYYSKEIKVDGEITFSGYTGDGTSFTILGGNDATNATLISWLQTNAKQALQVTNDIEGCTLSPLEVWSGSSYTGTLTPNSGVIIPSTVYVNGTGYAVGNEGQFTVPASAITGNFHVTGTTAVIKDVKLKVGTDILLPQTKVRNITDLTATASELNVLDGITATTAELNYVDGVTSNIQTQLDAKQATISDIATIRSNASLGATALQPNATITGATKAKITYDAKGLVTAGADLTANDIPSLTLSKISDVTATAAELNLLDDASLSSVDASVLDGVTSNIQTQLNAKEGTISDLATIRSGAALGATALQSVPNTYRTSADQDVIDAGKQATLVSGTNIKTINNQSILGDGNLTISGGISYEEIQ